MKKDKGEWIGRLILWGLLLFFIVHGIQANFDLPFGCGPTCQEARMKRSMLEFERMSPEEQEEWYQEYQQQRLEDTYRGQ